MSKLLPIVEYPNPVLTTKAKPIETITQEIQQLAQDMLHTMQASGGIGLAANQVGVLQRIIVTNIETSATDYCNATMPLVLINPEVTYASKELMEYSEGCLSFPGLHFPVKHPNHVKVSYTNLQSQPCEVEAFGLHAICLQHEIDHIDGILFIHRVSSLKRDMLLRKYRKIKQERQNSPN